MSIKSLCTPRPSVYAVDRRATVLNLDTFLKGQINGTEFFEENYFTNGMLTLVDRAFRHLGGQGAGSSVFLLSQAMGGGKTHSMIALGLLARDPVMRDRVLEHNPAIALGACRVVGFNGRSTDLGANLLAPFRAPHPPRRRCPHVAAALAQAGRIPSPPRRCAICCSPSAKRPGPTTARNPVANTCTTPSARATGASASAAFGCSTGWPRSATPRE